MDILKEFNRSNKYEQANILFANGEFIGSRKYGDLKVNLFRLDHYLFEVHYNPRLKQIERVVRIQDADTTALYFEGVDISEVLGDV